MKEMSIKRFKPAAQPWRRERCQADVGLSTQRYRYLTNEANMCCQRVAVHEIDGKRYCDMHAGRELVEAAYKFHTVLVQEGERKVKSVQIQNPRYGNYVFIWDSKERKEIKQFPYTPKDAASQKRAIVKAHAYLEEITSETN